MTDGRMTAADAAPTPALPGTPSADATLEDGAIVRLERRYRHSVERVWRALDDPDELRHWFPSDEPLHVEERVPPRLLAGTWYGERLRFELEPLDDGCLLVLTHALGDRATAARTATGWHCCLLRLEALLQGAPLGEAASLDAWPALDERYAETLGVDLEIAGRAFAVHPLT